MKGTSLLDRICKFFNHPFRRDNGKIHKYTTCRICGVLIGKERKN